MAGLSGPAFIGTVDLYTSNTDQGGPELGQLVFGPQGKAYRYVKAGASNLTVGNVLQSSAIDTQFDDMSTTVQAAGVTTFTVTNGTTVLTGDEFKGGTAEMSVTPGLGDEYTILGNSAAGSGATLTLYLDRPLRTTTSVATKVTLRKCPWNGVIQAPVTTLTGAPVGVAIYAIAASSYGWVQTKGVAAVLSDGTSIIAGSDVMAVSPTTAGKCSLTTAGKPRIGYAMRAASDAKTIPVFLQID